MLSIQVLYISLHKPFKEYGISGSLCSASLLSVKTWMEGTRDMPYKNPYFFMTNGPNRMPGFFVEMQIISYSFIILKHIQINLQFRKLLMLKVQLYFFFFGGGQSVYCTLYPFYEYS